MGGGEARLRMKRIRSWRRRVVASHAQWRGEMWDLKDWRVVLSDTLLSFLPPWWWWWSVAAAADGGLIFGGMDLWWCNCCCFETEVGVI